MSVLYLSRDIRQEIISHCRDCYPQEACGIIGGREARGEIVYRLANISDKPELCYLIDPKEQLRIFKELRSQEMELAAVYHSHAHSPAYPSARDIELAFYPDSFYVIASLEDKDNPCLRAFRIVDGRVEEGTIEDRAMTVHKSTSAQEQQ